MRYRERAGWNFPAGLRGDPLHSDLWNHDGTTVYTFYEVLGHEAQDLGPYIENIEILAYSASFSPNFKYKVIGEYSNDGGQSWKGFAADLLVPQTSPDHVNGTPYS